MMTKEVNLSFIAFKVIEQKINCLQTRRPLVKKIYLKFGFA